MSKDTHPQEIVAYKPAMALWDVRECAAYLGISTDSLYDLLRRDQIPYLRLLGPTGHARFVPSVIEEWAAKRSMENYKEGAP